MFGAFSLQKDCRLNTVAAYWPASYHLHGSHTAPGVGEGTKKTTSVDDLSVITAGDGTICSCGGAEGPGQGQKREWG